MSISPSRLIYSSYRRSTRQVGDHAVPALKRSITTSNCPISRSHRRPSTISVASRPLACVAISPRNTNHRNSNHRHTYYTASTPEPTPFPPVEEAILSAALTHVPEHGFTTKALTLGAVDAGYLPSSVNLFPSGAFDLVRYHLVIQRVALKHSVQFPTPTSNPTPQGGPRDPKDTTRILGTGAKVRALTLARLKANEPIIHHLPEAIGLMSLAGNIPASTAELGRLVDEIWYLAGDVSVDTSWYTKRGLLAGVYASSEVFMSQDRSVDFKETQKFLDRRLGDVMTVGGAAGAVTEWVGFTAMSAVNVARSWGVRI